MNLDTITDIVCHYYRDHVNNKQVARSIFIHYGANELRLFGRELHQFVTKAVSRRLIQVVELSRFCPWYYINYMRSVDKGDSAANLITLQLPPLNWYSILNDYAGVAIGIIQFRPLVADFRAAIEACVQQHRKASAALVTKVWEWELHREITIYLESPQGSSQGLLEQYTLYDLPSY